ncbi:MAG: hypothetical protein AVDCRST_MAG89-423, partial [uncultured Gemmatimonadetes bacterium]
EPHHPRSVPVPGRVRQHFQQLGGDRGHARHAPRRFAGRHQGGEHGHVRAGGPGRQPGDSGGRGVGAPAAGVRSRRPGGRRAHGGGQDLCGGPHAGHPAAGRAAPLHLPELRRKPLASQRGHARGN